MVELSTTQILLIILGSSMIGLVLYYVLYKIYVILDRRKEAKVKAPSKAKTFEVINMPTEEMEFCDNRHVVDELTDKRKLGKVKWYCYADDITVQVDYKKFKSSPLS